MATEATKSSPAPASPSSADAPLLKDDQKAPKRHNIMCTGHCFADQSPIAGCGVCDCGYIG